MMNSNNLLTKSKAYQYAKWCLEEDNKLVGKYIKKQAKKWIDIVDGKHDKAYVSEKAYKKVCKILKLMIHPDLGGKVTIYEGMEDYAWFFVTAILCTKSKEDKGRYYETGLLEISRKNYKTFVSAIIFIIGMILEPRFSRFFSVAPDYKLSNELKLAVRKIIKCSPVLEKRFKIKRDLVTCTLTDIDYTPLAYSNDGMDGKLANIFLADEAGALDDYPVEAMRSSQVTLLNKLGIIISTQYPNDKNVMIDEIDYAKKVLDDVSENDRYFALLYEPDEEIRKEWEKNDLVIYQSNPVAVNFKRLFNAIKEKRTMAVLYENKRENYLCKHNNIMYKGLGTEGYIDINLVKLCRIEEDLKFWQGKSVYLGLDLSISDDNTSVAMITMVDGKLYAKVWAFIPENKIDEKSNKEKVDYRKMKSCFGCGDNTIDYTFVEDFIIELQKNYGVNIIQIGYDQYNCLATARRLEKEKFDVVEVKQHSSILHPATKLLKELILNKKFQYEENRLLEINFQNARCTEDTNRNKYVNKKKSKGKVDMVVSLIIATYLLIEQQLNNTNPNDHFKEGYSM